MDAKLFKDKPIKVINPTFDEIKVNPTKPVDQIELVEKVAVFGEVPKSEPEPQP